MLSQCRCTSSAVVPSLLEAIHNAILSQAPSRSCRSKPSSSPNALRCFSNTTSSLIQTPNKSNSIFSGSSSPWDQVFRDVDSYVSPSNLSNSLNSATMPQRRRPRQAMTARESNAFNKMFEMIFDAVSVHESNGPLTSHDSVVGVGRGGIDDLIGKLRKYPRRLKYSMELDDVVDRHKEVIDLFTTDQELLEWAQDAIFEESRRYETAVREAISAAAKTGVYGELPMLQPPAYPHLLAHVMRTFRDKFDDPHLALSMFEHARRLSIASYVFGCSSEAYHELLETRWNCFQDLQGVHETLVEMRVNGVKVDIRTRQLTEKIRKQVGEHQIWVEESELGTGEVWHMLTAIERLVASGNTSEILKPATKKRMDTKSKKWDVWKTERLEDMEGDEWGFDKWDKPASRPSRGGSNTRPQNQSTWA